MLVEGRNSRARDCSCSYRDDAHGCYAAHPPPQQMLGAKLRVPGSAPQGLHSAQILASWPCKRSEAMDRSFNHHAGHCALPHVSCFSLLKPWQHDNILAIPYKQHDNTLSNIPYKPSLTSQTWSVACLGAFHNVLPGQALVIDALAAPEDLGGHHVVAALPAQPLQQPPRSSVMQ